MGSSITDIGGERGYLGSTVRICRKGIDAVVLDGGEGGCKGERRPQGNENLIEKATGERQLTVGGGRNFGGAFTTKSVGKPGCECPSRGGRESGVFRQVTTSTKGK